jgi:antitoxin VapB
MPLPNCRYLIYISQESREHFMQNSHHVSLSTNGQAQVLTIPPEFALSGTEVLLRKEGHRLIIEPVSSGSLLSLLATLPSITEDFADTDKALLPLDDIKL